MIRGSSLLSRPWPLVVLDLSILYTSALVGYGVHASRRSMTEQLGGPLSLLAVPFLYVVVFVVHGEYSDRTGSGRTPRLASLGALLVGTWGLVLLASASGVSFVPSQTALLIHGPLALVGLIGARAALSRRSSPPDPAPQPIPNTGTKTSSAPSASSGPSVPLDDLIPRKPIEIDRSALRTVLSDRTVLVTGAAGSIGRRLSAQLLDLRPRRLLLLDMNEQSLYRLDADLRTHPHSDVAETYIADVREKTGMDALLRRETPQVVFHAAAYKQVPLMERHPAEAVRNNTLATARLHRLCERHGVEDFAFVSTDKAVHPASVLGMTKQWAEHYVRTSPASMRTRVIRFGNVYGSRGSVVPRFEQKLAVGAPLPVTHPEMERYFMTADEACSLLLHTLLLDAHAIYLLRMGEPVRIQWLAEQLIERWHPDVDPASMIEYVGPRPGEKLSEQLVRDTESVHATNHPSIQGLDGPVPYTRSSLDAYLRQLRSRCEASSETNERVRQLLFQGPPVAASSAV